MKKLVKSMLLVMCLAAIVLLSGCNFNGSDWIDTGLHFNRAIISLPNGEVVEGGVLGWTRAEGEQLAIELDDGKCYLASPLNCVLIED